MADLSRLFAPEHVAVVGASDESGSVGHALMANLLSDFDGDVVPINPNRESVFDQPCLDSVAETTIDLAVVAVPASAVVDVVREAGESGVRTVVVVTAGFSEEGGSGATRERELTDIANTHDINLVGPNSLGVLSSRSGLNATFGPQGPLPGNVSFMSQSGAFITAVLDWAKERGLGFLDIVSLGNKAVLDETAFVQFWGADEKTTVVLGYIEGITDGERFVQVAREVTRETPVVLVKSGRTEAGAHAAASHTGAIAGSESAYEAGLTAAGVLQAASVEELFDYASVLAGQPLPESDTVAVISNAGGPGVMATDAVGSSALELASFATTTARSLAADLPTHANIHNPVDIIGDATSARFQNALETVLSAPEVGSIVVIACPTTMLSFESLAKLIAKLNGRYPVPIAVCLMGGATTEAAEQRLAEAGIPCYFDPARAVRALDGLRAYREIQQTDHTDPLTYDIDRTKAAGILEQAVSTGEHRIGVERMDLLGAYGIPTADGEIATSPEAAERISAQLDTDAVMKIVSPDILHKSDIGGVVVGVAQTDVAQTYRTLLSRARRYQSDATILGVQVQEQVAVDAGVETIVGANRDPQFGPLVLFGLGGVFVEVFEDTAVRLAPVTEMEAQEMVEEIQASPLLRGVRGQDPVDQSAIVDVIGRLSQLVTDFPAILELDVNPLVVTSKGVTAVDFRLLVDPEELENNVSRGHSETTHGEKES
jgi:acetyltransferase